MGSGLQILLPLAITGYFLYQRQLLSSAVCLMWAGMNLSNVSVYAGDAIAMQLPLLGGDGVVHDWNYILTELNILSWTPQVTLTLFVLGVICIGVGIAGAFSILLKTR